MSGPYYVVMVKCGSELNLLSRLKEGGVMGECPTFQDQFDETHPALDGYVFIELESVPNLGQLRARQDVLKVVAFDGIPSILDELEFERVKELALLLEAWVERQRRSRRKLDYTDLKVGDKVMVLVSMGMRIRGHYIGKGRLEVRLGHGIVKKIDIKNALRFERV